MKKLTFTVLLFTLWSGCSKQESPEVPEYLKELDHLTVYPADSESEVTIELIPEVVFEETDEVILGRTAGIVVDDNERVYIADRHANTVYVYNSDGSYFRSIGRQGEGPGEFMYIWSMDIGNEWIHIQCNVQRLIHVYSIDTFELVHTTSLFFEEEQSSDITDWVPNVAHVINDRKYLVGFYQALFEVSDAERSQRLYTVTSEGQLDSDVLQELHWGGEYLTDRSIPMVVVVPYGRTTLLTVTEEAIYTLWTEDLAVQKHDYNGKYLSAFYHPVRKRSLNLNEVMEQINFTDERQRHMVRNTSLPETWPAVQHFLMDDEQRFWISVIIDDQNLYEWWVLKENGELIDRFTWPREKNIQFVKNNKLYVLETDQESGLDQIVRYKVIY